MWAEESESQQELVGPGRRFSNFRRRRNRFCNYFSNLSSSLRNCSIGKEAQAYFDAFIRG